MSTGRHWKCANCGERVEGAFDVCWNCGCDREGNRDVRFEPAVAFHPECGHCGYLLVGLTDATRCPECGEPFDRGKRDTPRPLPKPT